MEEHWKEKKLLDSWHPRVSYWYTKLNFAVKYHFEMWAVWRHASSFSQWLLTCWICPFEMKRLICFWKTRLPTHNIVKTHCVFSDLNTNVISSKTRSNRWKTHFKNVQVKGDVYFYPAWYDLFAWLSSWFISRENKQQLGRQKRERNANRFNWSKTITNCHILVQLCQRFTYKDI